MPEGDTIYRAARAMARVLEGKVITHFETGLAKLASIHDDKPLTGRTIERIEPRGKWLLLHLSGDLILDTHMLMSGSWHLYRTGEKWQRPRRQMRVAIAVADWVAVGFDIPIAELHTAHSLARHPTIPKLGVDILSTAFTPQAGASALTRYAQTHPDTEIANALLNQRVLAGLGNVYKSEVTFAAGVNPFRPIATITPRELQHLADLAQRYLQANVADNASAAIVTYTGSRRTTRSMNQGDRLWVYGRAGKECRRCGATILSRKKGPQARITFWCPTCQPWTH
jgi:endonuclease-8